MTKPEFDDRNPFIDAKVVGANVANDDYHRKDPAIDRGHPEFAMSRSELLLFMSCPSRWRDGYEPKETAATEFGSLIDCLITEPAKFEERYAVQPKTVSATKTMACVKDGEANVGDPVPWRECAEAKEWKAMQGSKTVISAQEHEDANQAVAKVMADQRICELLQCSQKQVLVVATYKDKATGLSIPVKALIDLVPAKDSSYGTYLADFKTCRSADPQAWEKVIYERGYDAQAALYMDIYTAATGEDRNTFLHALMENLFPFQTGRRMVSLGYIGIGGDRYRAALKFYCQCLKANHWPDYDEASPLNGWTLIEPPLWLLEKTLRAEPPRMPKAFQLPSDQQPSEPSEPEELTP